MDALLQQTRPQAGGSARPTLRRVRQADGTRFTLPAMEPLSPTRRYGAAVRFATSLLPCHRRFGRGKTIVSVIPTKPSSGQALVRQGLRPPNPRRQNLCPANASFPTAREGTPVPDSKGELPPVIRRTEVVAFALVGLLIICIIAGLYLARAFFLPITMAFIVGTMLSPAASFLERYRIPRALAAVLIVAAAGAGVTFMVGLIASPAMEWSSKLPELGALLKEKLHVFDRPLALWQQLQSMLGGPDTLTTFHLPKIDWVQPTLEFLSPTFAEFLLFIATLILFIASWRDLRRALIMNFGERDGAAADAADPQRDRGASRQLPADGDHDQCRRRRRHRPDLRGHRHAQSGRPRRAGRDPEFHPDHRPGGDVRRPGRGRPGRVPDASAPDCSRRRCLRR